MEKVRKIKGIEIDGYSPEKAGVGGSIPSLATIFSITYSPTRSKFHSVTFQNFGPSGLASRVKLGIEVGLECSRLRLIAAADRSDTS